MRVVAPRAKEMRLQVCCVVLQYVAGCCVVLQCVAVCGGAARQRHAAAGVLQSVVACCSVLQCVAVCV